IRPAPSAPPALAAAILVRLPLACLARFYGNLHRLGFFCLLFVLGEGWRLDRARQRGCLAGAVSPQLLLPEIRRDQRIVARDHHLEPVTRLDLGQRIALLV